MNKKEKKSLPDLFDFVAFSTLQNLKEIGRERSEAIEILLKRIGKARRNVLILWSLNYS